MSRARLTAYRASRAVLAGAVGASPLLLALPSAHAAGLAAATPVTGATLRVAHLSPGTAPVDVSLTSLSGGSADLARAESYGQTSPYQAVPAGVYTVSARAAGSPADGKPLLSWTVEAKPGEAYTVAAVGSGAEARGTVLRDDLSSPAPGKGSVRFIQAASAAPSATVTTTGGAIVASPTSFGTATGYAQVPAGTWPLTASGVEDPSLRTQRPVSVPAGSVTSVILLDQPGGGVTLRSTVDASGASVMPRGGIDTGGGGTALREGRADGPTAGVPAAGVLAVAVLAAGMFAGVRRRREVSTE